MIEVLIPAIASIIVVWITTRPKTNQKERTPKRTKHFFSGRSLLTFLFGLGIGFALLLANNLISRYPPKDILPGSNGPFGHAKQPTDEELAAREIINYIQNTPDPSSLKINGKQYTKGDNINLYDPDDKWPLTYNVKTKRANTCGINRGEEVKIIAFNQDRKKILVQKINDNWGQNATKEYIFSSPTNQSNTDRIA